MEPGSAVRARVRWWSTRFVLPVLALATVSVLIDRSGLDGSIRAVCYEPASASFPLVHSWFFEGVLVHGGSASMALGALVLALAARRSSMSSRERCAYVLASVLLTTALALAWQAIAPLHDAGAQSAAHALPQRRSGPSALPAAGFSWMAIAFVAPRLRKLPQAAWLLPGILLGALLAATQIVRGVSLPSQELWSLALAWTVALILVALFDRRARRAGRMSVVNPGPAQARGAELEASSERADAALPWLAGVCAGLAGVAFFFGDLLLDSLDQRYEALKELFEHFELGVMGLGIGVGAYFLAEHLRDTRVRAGRRVAAEREERFRVLGRMAASVAHEVRNPLHTLRLILDEQSLELPALARHPLRPEVEANLGRINAAVDLVYRLARPQGEEDARADVVRATRDAIAAVERANPTLVRFDWRASEEAAIVRGSHVALGIVIDNLIRNAAAASPEGKVVTLRLERRDRDWVLEIFNAGSLATPAESRARARGASVEGLGLGLSISRQIAASAGARIELGEADGSVRCTLTWPAHDGEDA